MNDVCHSVSSSGGAVCPADSEVVPVSVRPGQILSSSSSVSISIEDRVRSFILSHDHSQDIHHSTLLAFFVQSPPLEDSELAAKSLIDGLVEEGALISLSGGLYRSVPELPDYGHLPERRERPGPLRCRGEARALGERRRDL